MFSWIYPKKSLSRVPNFKTKTKTKTVITGAGESLTKSSENYDRFQELKVFDDTKAGVNGLVDSNISKLPRIFVRPPEDDVSGERVLEEMLEAARGFHELPREEKAEYYSRDQRTSKVNYDSNFDLYKSKFANWRDTLFCVMSPHHQPLDPKELPPLCRSTTRGRGRPALASPSPIAARGRGRPAIARPSTSSATGRGEMRAGWSACNNPSGCK
ncbi:1-aminocyclopropane-1-carboxylate oxidase like protein [Quercus suber]|uniref:1-aminocyclopropane-1-carboxylate oxidase like protein n=1 Tax=Quercus suber TaxID=58331 RepID=A0AAW0M2I1_QUESU